MASSYIEPILHYSQVSDSKVTVDVIVDRLLPHKSEPHEAKNGNVDFEFFEQGFDMKAEVNENKNTKSLWKCTVHRLPGLIEMSESSWKVEKGKVSLVLIKKKNPEDSKEEYLNWKPLFATRGLDQYDSSEDEDGNLPNYHPIKLMADKLGLERGKEHVLTLHDTN